jgi:hypothetical protein
MSNKGPIVSVAITPERKQTPWYVRLVQAIIDFFRWLFGCKKR